MDHSLKRKIILRGKRSKRVRKNLRGNHDKPRLCVTISNKHIYAQIIDDEIGKTLASCSTLSKDLKETKTSSEAAKQIGTLIATKAQQKEIKRIVFDRGQKKYHGLIAQLATSAREAGLQF